MSTATIERTTRIMSARLGVVVASLDFRPAPEHVHPAQLDDAKTALAYFMRHAHSWKVDPQRIAVSGVCLIVNRYKIEKTFN